MKRIAWFFIILLVFACAIVGNFLDKVFPAALAGSFMGAFGAMLLINWMAFR